MGQTFYTADTHIGHLNIINYCDRPFYDVDHMNHTIVNNWNSVVSPEDTVIVLGDYALGDIEKSLALTRLMAGRKILVVGNHDRMFKGQKKIKEEKIQRETQRYLDAGFAEIWHGNIDYDLSGIPVVLSHFPYYDSQDTRHIKHRPIDNGKWLIHGHVHQHWTVKDHMINVGVDVWDFTPVPETYLVDMCRGR